MAQMMRRDIGEVLGQGKVITPEQLARAREIQSRTGRELADILRAEFNVNPFNILQAQAFLANMKAVDLSRNPPEPSAINLVPAAVAQRHRIVPIMRINQNGREML